MATRETSSIRLWSLQIFLNAEESHGSAQFSLEKRIWHKLLFPSVPRRIAALMRHDRICDRNERTLGRYHPPTPPRLRQCFHTSPVFLRVSLSAVRSWPSPLLSSLPLPPPSSPAVSSNVFLWRSWIVQMAIVPAEAVDEEQNRGGQRRKRKRRRRTAGGGRRSGGGAGGGRGEARRRAGIHRRRGLRSAGSVDGGSGGGGGGGEANEARESGGEKLATVEVPQAGPGRRALDAEDHGEGRGWVGMMTMPPLVPDGDEWAVAFAEGGGSALTPGVSE